MTKDQIDPYDELDPYAEDSDPYADPTSDDSDDWLATDDSPSPAPPTAGRPSHSPTVIQPDDEDTEDDYEASAEDFGDFTPRRTRFEAPRHEDVLLHSARKRSRDDGQMTNAERREQRRNERIANKQARVEAKRSAVDTDDPAPTRRKNTQAISTAAGILAVLGLIGGGSWYLTSYNDDNSQATAAEASATLSTSAHPMDSDPTTAAVPAVGEGEAPNELYAAIADACSEAGGTSENGDTSTPENAILGFNYAYFAEKNAESATRYLSDEMYNTVATLQNGIDDPENGDAHCTIIHPTDDPAVFEVEIQEFVNPAAEDQPITSWTTKQRVTLEEADGGWRIVEQSLA